MAGLKRENTKTYIMHARPNKQNTADNAVKGSHIQVHKDILNL